MFIHLLPTLKLKKPIPVVFKMVDNYVVKIKGTSISASGDTKQQALRNLRDIIEAKYALYCSRILDSDCAQQLKVLRSYIRSSL